MLDPISCDRCGGFIILESFSLGGHNKNFIQCVNCGFLRELDFIPTQDKHPGWNNDLDKVVVISLLSSDELKS